MLLPSRDIEQYLKTFFIFMAGSGGGATGIQKVRVMAIDAVSKEPPPQNVIQSVLSVVLNLRIHALGSYPDEQIINNCDLD